MKKLVLFFIICFSVMKGFSQNNFSDFNVPGGFAGAGSVNNSNSGTIDITTAVEDKIARDFERIFAKIKTATNRKEIDAAKEELKSIWESMQSSEKIKFKIAYKQIKRYANSKRKSLKKPRKRK